MKKLIAVLVVALVPALGFASDVAELAQSGLTVKSVAKPVVSVIALSASEANELAKVRDEYLAQKAQLEAEYRARLDALLAKPAATNS